MAFQTGRKNVASAYAEEFNHCAMTNPRLFLDKYYPYNNKNLDIHKDPFAQLYVMYELFQNSYYHRHGASPVL